MERQANYGRKKWSCPSQGCGGKEPVPPLCCSFPPGILLNFPMGADFSELSLSNGHIGRERRDNSEMKEDLMTHIPFKIAVSVLICILFASHPFDPYSLNLFLMAVTFIIGIRTKWPSFSSFFFIISKQCPSLLLVSGPQLYLAFPLNRPLVDYGSIEDHLSLNHFPYYPLYLNGLGALLVMPSS